MFSSCLLFVLHIGTNKKISTCRYHKNTIKCNRLQLPCGQGTNRLFEWAVWVWTANESKGGWLFRPVTCQQIQHHMFHCEKPEVYQFVFSHMPARDSTNRDQFVLRCMRSSDSFTQLRLEKAAVVEKPSRLSWPADGCAWKADSPAT